MAIRRRCSIATDLDKRLANGRSERIWRGLCARCGFPRYYKGITDELHKAVPQPRATPSLAPLTPAPITPAPITIAGFEPMTAEVAKIQNSPDSGTVRKFSYFSPPSETFQSNWPGRNSGLGPELAPDSIRILLACMPKSGSTFLSTAVSCLPGMRRAVLYPAPVRRREQEIDLLFLRQEEAKTLALRKGLVVKTRPMPKPKAKSRALAKRTWTGVLRDAIKGPVLALRQVTPAIPTFPTVPPGVHGRGYIAQHHIRYTDPTRWIMDDYGITPVVLVRNIFDALVSLRDHIKNDAIYMAMGYYNEDMRQWSDEKTADWLIDMVAPWYVNFFVSWQDCPNRLQLSFEQIRQDPKQCLLDVGNAAKLEISAADCEAALEKSKTKPTRLNKGVSGRGAAFTDKHRETVARYASYYPHVDFRDIGL